MITARPAITDTTVKKRYSRIIPRKPRMHPLAREGRSPFRTGSLILEALCHFWPSRVKRWCFIRKYPTVLLRIAPEAFDGLLTLDSMLIVRQSKSISGIHCARGFLHPKENAMTEGNGILYGRRWLSTCRVCIIFSSISGMPKVRRVREGFSNENR